jgi:hypothetical protein
MPPASNLSSISKAFFGVLGSAVALYNSMQDFKDRRNTWQALEGWEPIHPAQARRVMALAFMQMVSGWEEFVEGCFLRYMSGAAAPGGWHPRLRVGACNTIVHAAQILARDPGFRTDTGYLDWSSWSHVVNRAALFFHRGQPFTTITEADRRHLVDAIIVRNRVAHFSSKARADFAKLAKRHLGMSNRNRLPPGFNVGDLLLSKARLFNPTDGPDDYFGAYLEMFVRLTSTLAPANRR